MSIIVLQHLAMLCLAMPLPCPFEAELEKLLTVPYFGHFHKVAFGSSKSIVQCSLNMPPAIPDKIPVSAGLRLGVLNTADGVPVASAKRSTNSSERSKHCEQH